MSYDNRIPLKNGDRIDIVETHSGNDYSVEIKEEIGRGGSCIVYRGVRKNLWIGNELIEDPIYIIKEFYPKDLEEDIIRKDGKIICDDVQEDFEIRKSEFCKGQAKHFLYASENSENALSPIVFSGESMGTFYAINFPKQGKTLDSIDRKDYSIIKALELCESICEAIKKVHIGGKNNGFFSDMNLYLDCKPDNIFVCNNIAYLFDFDTVQPYGKIMYCSCSGWSAPEQKFDNDDGYSDMRKIGFHTDIYSIGAVLYYLFTGVNPSEEDYRVLDDIQNNDNLGIISLRDDTNALEYDNFVNALTRTIKNMLQPDPNVRKIFYSDRYSAEKAREELVHLVNLAKEAPAKKDLDETKKAIDLSTQVIRETIERQSVVLQEQININIESKKSSTNSEEKINNTQKQEYIGETQDGVPSGKGIFYYSNGCRIEGTFREGKPFGKMTYYFESSNEKVDKFEGDFEDYNLPASGSLFYKNGDKYFGEIENGEPHGFGILSSQSGEKYKGYFVNGDKEGFGTLNYANGDIFVGTFKNNSCKKGCFYYKGKSELYEGTFENGRKMGYGVLFYSDGTKRDGYFEEDRLNGLSTLTDSKGDSSYEYYIKGEKVDSKILESVEMDEPHFNILQIEHWLEYIKRKKYSFTTKDEVIVVCRLTKNILQKSEGKEIIRTKGEKIKNELSICANEYSNEAIRSGDSSLYRINDEIKETIGLLKDNICFLEKNKEIKRGFGPDRESYFESDFIAYPTINSVKNNNTFGDERYFIQIKKSGEESYSNNNPEIVPGEKYDIRIRYNNDGKTVAENVTISTIFPRVLLKEINGTIEGTISSSNSSPQEIWAQRFIKTSYEKIYLKYLKGSAVLHNNGHMNGSRLSDDLFSHKGVVIGFDDLDGSIQSGEDYSGFIEYSIEAEEIKGTIIQEASFDGFFYQNNLDVFPQANIYFRISIVNTGNAPLLNTVIRGCLSEGLYYIPGSLKLSANNTGILDDISDDFFKNGIRLGTIGIKNRVNIYYNCKIEDSEQFEDVMLSYVQMSYDCTTENVETLNSYSIIKVSKESISPWGPKREVFYKNSTIPHLMFNSIINDENVGDERNFVKIREANAFDKFGDEVKIISGKIYEVFVYFNNNYTPSLNNNKIIAQDVRIRSIYSKIVTPRKKYVVNASITSTNANPNCVWDGAYMTADDDVFLQFIPNSIRLHLYGSSQAIELDYNELFSEEGVLISPIFERLKSNSIKGYITYCLSANNSLEEKKDLIQNDNTTEVNTSGHLIDDEISSPVFNSIINHPLLGDERKFVRIRREDSNTWERSICICQGWQYEVEVSFRNDASSKYNNKEYQNKGVAFVSRMAIDLPFDMTSSGQIKASIKAKNTENDAYDEIELYNPSGDYLNLHFTAGSAIMHNSWKANNRIMPSNLFNYSKGTPIGLNDFNGVIPGGDDYSGKIRFYFEVVNPQFNHSLWGRKLFTNEKPPVYAVFNSIIDNPEIGDERKFVKVKEYGTEEYIDELTVEPGKEYEVFIYFRNDADESTNKIGYGMATNTRVYSYFPPNMKAGERKSILGMISWSFVNQIDDQPRTGRVKALTYLNSEKNVRLRYKLASAIIHNKGKANDSVLSKYIFEKEGSLLGVNKLAGTIPAGIEYAGYVSYILIVEEDI